MNKTVITTDSGINPISHINMIPGIIFGKETQYYDTVKINRVDNIKALDAESILEKRLNGEKFTTSSPSYSDYISVFRKILDNDQEIVHLSMSSGISSGSVNMSYQVIEELKKNTNKEIYLVDTLTAGSGGPIIEAIANDLANANLSAKEIKEKLNKLKHDILSTYYISTLSGYRESGRVPYGTKLLDMLSLRYRIDINDKGALYPKKFYRGSIKNTVTKYVRELINDDNIEQYNKKYISLLRMPLDKISIDEIRNYINSFSYFENILEDKFLGTISAYGVKDQIGIGLLKK